MSKDKTQHVLHAYGLTPNEIKTVQKQASPEQKQAIAKATDRNEVTRILGAIAKENGMNSKKPGEFVHP